MDPKPALSEVNVGSRVRNAPFPKIMNIPRAHRNPLVQKQTGAVPRYPANAKNTSVSTAACYMKMTSKRVWPTSTFTLSVNILVKTISKWKPLLRASLRAEMERASFTFMHQETVMPSGPT